MGYDYKIINNLINNKFLFKEKRILTLGTLYPYLSEYQLKKLKRQGLQINSDKNSFSYCLFVKSFGAKCVDSLDISDYQNADLNADLNVPIEKEFYKKYDVIIDFGTLEHLSNLKVALQNILDILVINGIYIFALPSNNWPNHGFFQFSATFFNDLCRQNKFLKVNDLAFGIKNNFYPLKNQSYFLTLAIMHSYLPTSIKGILFKIQDGEIDMNFIQGRYKKDFFKYETQSISIPKKKQKTIIQKINRHLFAYLTFFLKSAFIPFLLKKIIANVLFKITKK